MAQPTNLYDSYDAEGKAEDVSDLIHNISPTETPVLTMAGTTKATAKLHQWQEDVLRAPAANAALEGDDAGLTDGTPTDQIVNPTQISETAFGVSGTLEVVAKYGRDSELAYQAAKSARELKTDVDFIICGLNQAAVQADSPRNTASLEAQLKTNTSIGGGAGANGGWNGTVINARTDGTLRAFTTTLLDDAIELGWNNGARLEGMMLVMGASQKRNFATFDGVGARRTDAESRAVVNTADIYMSLYGDMKVVPSRHIRKTAGVDRNVFGIDPEYLKVAYLRPWQQYDLAKTGDSIQRQMVVEWCLEVCNEKAHILVADVDNS